MKRVKINTPYDPEIQVPKAFFPEQKQEELDRILNASDQLASRYFEARKNPDSRAAKDKQMQGGCGLVLFDRGYEVVTYRYVGTRDFVAQYEEN